MSFENSHSLSIENEFATYRIQSRLLFLEFKTDVFLDLVAAQRIVADRLLIQEGRDCYVICDVTGVWSATTAALNHLSGVGSEQIKAVAFITTSELAYSKLNLYLNNFLQPVETKVFCNQPQAVAYLSSYI